MSKTFDFSIELDNSIAAPPKEVSRGRKRSLEDSDDESPKHLNGNAEDEDEDEEEDEWADHEEIDDADPEALKKKKRMAIIKQHLQLLAEDSFKFLKHESTRGMDEWSINYKELGKLIKQLEVEKVVEERFGSMGTRLLRIVKDKGKLDEKQVCSTIILFSPFIYSQFIYLDRKHSPPKTKRNSCDSLWPPRSRSSGTPGSTQNSNTTGFQDVFLVVL